VDPNDTTQFKVLLDPFLERWLENKRKNNPHIFHMITKINFNELFFKSLFDFILGRHVVTVHSWACCARDLCLVLGC
jgi:late competence protein required for DNA uptake (superfamily II DNA/RNA helicase)